MSIIDRAAESTGMTLHRDVPIPGQRRGKDWATLIGMARKLESQEAELEKAQHHKIEELAAKNVELTMKIASLQRENDNFKIRERMRQMELSEKDQKFLLTGATNPGNGHESKTEQSAPETAQA